jgi:dynein heavy chain
MYKDIQILSERFWKELRTPYYVTPNLFLDCLSIFQRILVSRGEKMSKLTEKYEIGLEKLKQTEDEVYRMHKILEDLRPKLAKLSMENNEMLNNLQTKQLEADEKLKFCEMEEQETAIQKNKSDELRSECKIELDRVLPLLHASAQALNKISKDDLTKIRSYTNPPKAVDIVIQGICYLLEEDVNVKWKKGEGEGEEKVQDFWEYAKKKMLNDKLIKKIQMFKEEKIRRISKERLAKLYVIHCCYLLHYFFIIH